MTTFPTFGKLARWLNSTREIVNEYSRLADQQFVRQSKCTLTSLSEEDLLTLSMIREDFVQDAEEEERERPAKEKLEELLECWRLMPDVASPVLSDKRPEREHLKLQMNMRLGLWLAFYCIGAPQLTIWEEIGALGMRLQAFPGDAFFDKLVGDAYRAERVGLRAAQSKFLYGYPDVPENEFRDRSIYAGLHVLAFTPILLLPDEDEDCDDHVSVDENDRQQDLVRWFGQMAGLAVTSETAECVRSYRRFVRSIERLSRRYVRFQMWRYLRDPRLEVLSIHYAVSRSSASVALERIAERRLNRLSALHRSGSRTEDLDANAWRACLDAVKAESDARVAVFLGAPADKLQAGLGRSSKRRLVVLKHNPDRRSDRQRGVVSCALGGGHGVVASRPDRRGSWEDCCFYLEGLPLAVEREKVKQLWMDFDGRPGPDARLEPTSSPILGFEYGADATVGFAEQWYDASATSFGDRRNYSDTRDG